MALVIASFAWLWEVVSGWVRGAASAPAYDIVPDSSRSERISQQVAENVPTGSD